MGLSLYALTDQFRELERLGSDEELDQNTLEAITNTLDSLQGDIQTKATNVAAYMLNLEAYATAAAQASAKLAERATRIKKRANHLREYIRVNLEQTDIKKIEGTEFTINRRANPPSVEVFDLAAVPDEYRKDIDPTGMARAILESARGAGTPTEGEDDTQTDLIIISLAALKTCIEAQLPTPDPDKTKIAQVLKDAERTHVDAIMAAQKEGVAPPEWVNPVPGCKLVRGERLEVK